MIVEKKYTRSGTMRMPRAMRAAVGDEIMLMVFGEVTVITPAKYELEGTLKSLRAIMRMMESSAELEEESMQAEMKEVLG